jgi:hypothetical protein
MLDDHTSTQPWYDGPSKSSERVITATPFLTIDGRRVLPGLSPWRVLAGKQKWALPGRNNALGYRSCLISILALVQPKPYSSRSDHIQRKVLISVDWKVVIL